MDRCSGVYTADPRDIASAKLLLQLNYEEDQELAYAGAKVLHPKCILPLKQSNIPLFIKWMENPNYQGSKISATGGKNNSPMVKAVFV